MEERVRELEAENAVLKHDITVLTAAEPSSTPYDDAWRTTITDLRQLLIPLVNVIFGEHYTERASVVFSPNEHFLAAGTQQEVESRKRITDSSFRISEDLKASEVSEVSEVSEDMEDLEDMEAMEDLSGVGAAAFPLPGDRVSITEGAKEGRYLIECESSPVRNSFLVRLSQYVITTGIDENRETEGGKLIITLPRTAVLSLRSTRNTPDALEIIIRTEQGEVHTKVIVVKMSDYSIDDIFQKKLYLLIPFILFNREKILKQAEKDDRKRGELLAEIQGVFTRLDALIPEDENKDTLIDVFASKSLKTAAAKVAEGLAAKYPKIREGVKAIMGGKIYDYEAKRIKREGIQEGIQQGIQEGKQEGMQQGMRVGATDALNSVAERLIRLETDGATIAAATGYDREKIDAIARRIERTVLWKEAAG